MKRLTAVLCAALLIAAACVTSFAAENPSPQRPFRPWRPWRRPYVESTSSDTSSSSSAQASSSTTSSAAATTQSAVSGTPVTVDPDPSVTTVGNGRAIVLAEADAKDYAEGSVERKIISLFSDGNKHDVSEIFSIIGVSSETLQAAPSNKVVGLSGLEPISKPLALKYADTGALVEQGKLKGTFVGNEPTKNLTDGQLFALSIETRSNPTATALGDGSVDASNNVTAYFQNTGLQLLMKNNG